MTLPNLFSRWLRRPPPLSPEEAELRRYDEKVGVARREGATAVALAAAQEGLAAARRHGSLIGEESFLGLCGMIETENGQYEAGETYLQEAITTAEKTNEKVRVARAMGNLGAHYVQRELLTKAGNILEQALEVAKAANDPIVLGLNYANLGAVYLKQQNASYALRMLKDGMDQLQNAPSAYRSGGIAFAVGLYGQAHLAMNDAERGFRLLTQAIRLAQQATDLPMELRWTNALAAGLFHAGQINDALKLYERCDEIAPRIQRLDPDYQNDADLNRATIYVRQNQPMSALPFLERALKTTQSRHDRILEGKTLALLAEVYKTMDRVDEAIQAAEKAVVLYEQGDLEDRSAQVDALLTLGTLQNQRNAEAESSLAMATFQKALALTEPEQDKPEKHQAARAKALRRIGSLHQSTGNLVGAVEAWSESVDLFEKSLQPAMAARVVCEIGAAKRQLNGINAALPEYERAMLILNTVRDTATRGLVLSNVANLYTDLGEIESAAAFFQEAIQLARQAQDRRSEAVRLGNYAWFHIATGRTAEAIRLLEESIALARPLADKVLIAVQTNNLGQSYHAQKDYASARGLFTQAIHLIEALKDRHWVAVFQSNLAKTALAQGNTQEALELLTQALPISREANDLENIVRIQVRLGETYLALGQLDSAEGVAKEAEVSARKQGYRKGQADALIVRMGVAKTKGTQAEADRLAAEAGKLYTILHDPLASVYAPKPTV
jgi:tetratricopeptide (TPR) repeat protein